MFFSYLTISESLSYNLSSDDIPLLFVHLSLLSSYCHDYQCRVKGNRGEAGEDIDTQARQGIKNNII